MAMNLDAVLKIAAKVTGLQDLSALEKGIQGAEKAATAAQGGFKAMLNSAAWQGAAAAAAGLGVAIGLSVRAAIQFEESFAGVRKVVDGLETPAALNEMKQEIIGLSTQMPITAQGFADIYAAAGASGIAKGEIKEFAILVAQVATAFDMTAEEAGRALAQMRVSLGLSTKEVASLADTMNYLDNNTGASAAQLVEFMNRSGAVGKMAGLSAQQTAGFGAAMIQAGTHTEVAATSFNNMIKALSKGPSMTERQVSALGRLGYAVVDAATKEAELTAAVERESAKRLDVYRAETDALLKELSRRYRNQLQDLQDQWEDESKEFERALQRRSQAQMRDIQDNESMSEAAKQAAIDRIQDQMDEELTVFRRAQRDKQQAIQDRLDDQKEREANALEQVYKDREAAEKAQLDKDKAAAKKRAEEMANQFKQGFSDRMQKDAIGTIMEVLKKIADLPKSQQVSVISDLFGDEARGLNPLIANIGELDRVLAMSNDKTKAAGSVLKEYATRSETTANSMQLLVNKIDALQIAFGDSFLGSLDKLMKLGLGPIIDGLTWMIQNIPLLGPIIGVVSTAFIGLVAVAPFISGFITLLGQIAPLIATIVSNVAGILTVIQLTFTAILTWIGGTFIPGLLAFFGAMSPVGWVVLAIAGVTLLVIAFREQLGAFATWLWEWGKPIREFWSGIWNAVAEFAQSSLDTIGGILKWAFEAWYAITWQIFVQPWINLWENVLKEPVTELWQSIVSMARKAWDAITDVWKAFVKWWDQTIAKPVIKAWNFVINTLAGVWNGLVEGIKKAMKVAVEFVKGIWTSLIGTLKNLVSGFLNGWINSINQVIRGVNKLIAAFNQLPGPDIRTITELPNVKLAKGGVVNGPTVALIGEGGEPEYVIPQSKMGKASQRYLAGARGGSVVPMASGGFVTTGGAGRDPVFNIAAINMQLSKAHAELTRKFFDDMAKAQNEYYASVRDKAKARATEGITVNTGPVMEYMDKRFVLLEDYLAGLQEARQQAIESTLDIIGQAGPYGDFTGIYRKASGIETIVEPITRKWSGW